MKKYKNGIIITILCLTFLVLGVVVGKMIRFPYFEISKSIDTVNILSIIITILLAGFLTMYFDKKKSDNRIEKDIILRRVENVYEITNQLQEESISGSIEYTEASSSVKRINTSLNSIYNTIEKCHFTVKDDIKTSITFAIGEIRDVLTNTPPKDIEKQIKKSNLPIDVKDGIISYSKQRIRQIDAKFDKLKDLIFELEIRINSK